MKKLFDAERQEEIDRAIARLNWACTDYREDRPRRWLCRHGGILSVGDVVEGNKEYRALWKRYVQIRNRCS